MRRTEPILVVDDDPDIQDLITLLLSSQGYTVLGASSGASALELASRHHPGLILLDMRMPGMDGWQFAAAYHQTPGPHAPIVVLTAARDAAQRATEIAADAYLPKPFQLDELLEVVGRYVEPE